MKIFFITRGWPSEKELQKGIYERDQAVALSNRGHQVYCLTLDIRSRFGEKNLGITKFKDNGVVVYDYYAGSRWAVLLKGIAPKMRIKAIEALFMHLYAKVVKKEGAPDVVYGHHLRYIDRALEIKQRYGIPTIGIEHWSEMAYDHIKEPIKQHAKEVYPRVDKMLVVSEALRDNVLRQVGVDTTVVHNIVGDEFLYKELVKHDNVVRFVLTGNLIPRKRFDLVIKALGNISPVPKNVQVTIIGEGEERGLLTQLIEKYNLGGQVFLVGRKPRSYIVEKLQKSDVFILSSFSETFGIAPIEAMACGVPVIATDCGGSRCYMNDFNGIMVPVDDVKAMSDAIVYMIAHCHEYDRKRIADDCRQRFSSESIGIQLETIFKEVVANSTITQTM